MPRLLHKLVVKAMKGREDGQNDHIRMGSQVTVSPIFFFESYILPTTVFDHHFYYQV